MDARVGAPLRRRYAVSKTKTARANGSKRNTTKRSAQQETLKAKFPLGVAPCVGAQLLAVINVALRDARMPWHR